MHLVPEAMPALLTRNQFAQARFSPRAQPLVVEPRFAESDDTAAARSKVFDRGDLSIGKAFRIRQYQNLKARQIRQRLIEDQPKRDMRLNQRLLSQHGTQLRARIMVCD